MLTLATGALTIMSEAGISITCGKDVFVAGPDFVCLFARFFARLLLMTGILLGFGFFNGMFFNAVLCFACSFSSKQ